MPLLLRFVREDIGEEPIVSLIATWLAVAPIGYRRRWLIGPREALGLVQGGILSPVLSNAYLHRFDQALATRDIKRCALPMTSSRLPRRKKKRGRHSGSLNESCGG